MRPAGVNKMPVCQMAQPETQAKILKSRLNSMHSTYVMYLVSFWTMHGHCCWLLTSVSRRYDLEDGSAAEFSTRAGQVFGSNAQVDAQIPWLL